MRIAHVVTFLDARNSFGGPSSVAIVQASNLARRGHSVDVYALTDGTEPAVPADVKFRLFKAKNLLHGRPFSGLFSARCLFTFLFSARRYDVVHIHLARDLITLPAAMIAVALRKRLVVQTHGMIVPDRRRSARLLDALFVRYILRFARVASLTQNEENEISRVAGRKIPTYRIINAVEAGRPLKCSDREQLVVFISRLHERKRLDLVISTAEFLLTKQPEVSFEVYGPDEGELASVRQAESRLANFRYCGTLDAHEVRTNLRRAKALLLPSEGEVFPMIVLEALSEGTPVILSSDCPIVESLEAYGACAAVHRTTESISAQIVEIMSRDSKFASISDGGIRASREWVGVERLLDSLERLYLCNE